MKTILLACVLLVFIGSVSGQKCSPSIFSAKRDALANIPSKYRKALVQRLNCYVNYLQSNDVQKLYDFATGRKKQGLSREDFVRSAKVSTEGDILSFKIRRVVMAGTDGYVDEPKPSPGEGNKWWLSGCVEIRINGKTRKYDMGFDVWLTQGQWYVNRGGLSLAMDGGGYRECEN